MGIVFVHLHVQEKATDRFSCCGHLLVGTSCCLLHSIQSHSCSRAESMDEGGGEREREKKKKKWF